MGTVESEFEADTVNASGAVDRVRAVSPECVLVLALSRHQPRAEHIAHARAVVLDGVDWVRVHGIALRNYVVPLFARNLMLHLGDLVPSDVSAPLQKSIAEFNVRSMILAAKLIYLVDRILVPRAVRFALLKGMGLSRRLYGDERVRVSQDIDLLIEEERVAEVVGALADHGWRVVNPLWHGQPIEDFSRFSSVVEMQSAEGVRVELHRLLDNTGLVMDSRRILGRAVKHRILGRDLPLLEPADDFAYTCMHHSRHAWGSMHWCADLSAMADAAASAAGVLSRARVHRRLRPTIAEALLLASNLDAIARGGGLDELGEQSQFLPRCLSEVDADFSPLFDHSEVHPGAMEPDFPFQWQKTPAYRLAFQLSRIRPTLNDYDAWPISPGWQWLYWISRPVRVLVQRLGTRVVARS